MESPIYIVLELLRIIRVVGDHVFIKVKFSLITSLLQKWHCFIYLDLLSCVRNFLHMHSK